MGLWDNIRSLGLRSRGPAILVEGEPAGEPVLAEGVERPEVDLVERDDVEILGVSTQPGPSSAQERRIEVQQPGSPSVLMPTTRVVKPSLLSGFLAVKPRLLRPLGSICHLRHLKSTTIISVRKSTSAMKPLFLILANSRIYQRKRYKGTSL